MPDQPDHPEARMPGEMTDERLDRLLGEACWPRMSPAVLERIVDVALPPVPAAHRGRAVWWIGTLAAAAALAVAAMLWALWPSQSPQPVVERQPGVEGVEPAREPEAPRFHYAVLPGREATAAERAWAHVIRREQIRRDRQPQPEQPEPRGQEGPPTLSEKVRPGTAATPAHRSIAPRSRQQQLLAILLDPAAEPAERQQAAGALPAVAIEQALADPALAPRAPELAAALAICQDPAAAAALVRLAEQNADLAVQVVASAPAGAPGVLGLIDCLNDPLISRREEAAGLLAASRDPAVLDALAQRLGAPTARREVLIALLLNDAAQARSIVARAEAHPRLRAIVHSLRLQGYGTRRETSQVQMIIL